MVDAVSCGIAIQDGVGATRLGTAGNASISWRIGIHLGDVIAEGEDIHGDGVNVAARLDVQSR